MADIVVEFISPTSSTHNPALTRLPGGHAAAAAAPGYFLSPLARGREGSCILDWLITPGRDYCALYPLGLVSVLGRAASLCACVPSKIRPLIELHHGMIEAARGTVGLLAAGID
jgi:hypothetical protein